MITLSTRLGSYAPLIRHLVKARLVSEASSKFLTNHLSSNQGLHSARSLATSTVLRCEEKSEEDSGDNGKDKSGGKYKKYVVHPVETSIRYMKSNAYKRAYGEEPVWVPYRRNFKGQYPPETREKCVRGGFVKTGSPCPICRDEYLVLHYKNVALLEQFISPTTGETLKTKKTGICQKSQLKLELEIMKAHDLGTLQFEVPIRRYKYTDYYPQLSEVLNPDYEEKTTDSASESPS